MLVSRALNRGYGMSRYRWPLQFALLNNDALWVMDETQLMGVTVETSAQLDGFRHQRRCALCGVPDVVDERDLELRRNCHGRPSRSSRRDGRGPAFAGGKAGGWHPREIRGEEAAHQAPFSLSPRPRIAMSASSLRSDSGKAPARNFDPGRGQPGGPRPGAIPPAGQGTKRRGGASRALIHSRFRRPDRRHHRDATQGEGDRIVIATQAVEAGVDVSARLLITELAPWASMVQRFGRCNRRGVMTTRKSSGSMCSRRTTTMTWPAV